MTGPFGFSDPAKRVSDTCRQAIADGHGGQFMAFALDDGRSNATCYLTRADAIRHHGNAARVHMYVRLPWDDVTPRAAEVFLQVHRQLATIGQHVADSELPQSEWMLDQRREAYPRLDRRRELFQPDPATGLLLPRGHQ